jgi:RHS repeat-associated protein
MTTYSYDRENRLISQNVDGNVTSFAYDGFGRKRRESRGVNPDVILNWDGDQMIVESSDLDPEAPSKAYYVADGVIYAENANLGSRRSRRDYAVDFLGSVTGLTDSDASLSSVRRWSAYGKLLSGSSEPIGYFWTGNTGSRVYQSLGLNDNRARHYGRNIKQWITRDPLWPSELPYAYVGGNPVTLIDPNGRAGVHPSFPHLPTPPYQYWKDCGTFSAYATEFCIACHRTPGRPPTERCKRECNRLRNSFRDRCTGWNYPVLEYQGPQLEPNHGPYLCAAQPKDCFSKALKEYPLMEKPEIMENWEYYNQLMRGLGYCYACAEKAGTFKAIYDCWFYIDRLLGASAEILEPYFPKPQPPSSGTRPTVPPLTPQPFYPTDPRPGFRNPANPGGGRKPRKR